MYVCMYLHMYLYPWGFVCKCILNIWKNLVVVLSLGLWGGLISMIRTKKKIFPLIFLDKKGAGKGRRIHCAINSIPSNLYICTYSTYLHT